MAFIDNLRAAADNGFSIVAQKSLSPYHVFLVTITNDQINFDDTAAGRVRTDTRITVGKGYSTTYPGDGYLNPHVSYVNKNDLNQTVVLSGAALSDIELMLGPIAYQYNTGFQTGGFGSHNFQPPPSGASNTQIYVRLMNGEGLNRANGNYFKIKEVVLNGMDNIFYYVRLTAISDVIPA